MRVKKWGIGAALLATVMLVGCSATTEAPGGSTASAPPSAATASKDCPQLKEGATIEGKALGTCVMARMSKIAGYAAATNTMGVVSKARYNPASKSVAVDSPMGSLIVVDGVAYVKSTSSAWQKADPASTDPVIAGLSTASSNLSSLDPTAVAATLNGTFTVSGTDTRLGKPVFVVTGKVESQGISSDTTYDITADYAVLGTKSSAEVSGQHVEVTMDVTEWDVKQDIVAPL